MYARTFFGIKPGLVVDEHEKATLLPAETLQFVH
jgi:hypothetical protein